MGEAIRHFDVDLDWRGAVGTAVMSGVRTPIVGAGVGSLSGEPCGWNPEELLLGALGLCLMRTFETLARREGLHVAHCRSRIEVALGPTPYGTNAKLGFTLLTAHVEVAVYPRDVSRARDLVVQAKQFCVVANALMPPVHLELEVEAVQPVAVGN